MLASHGSFIGAGLPQVQLGSGLQSPFGLHLPTARVAAYVNSNGYRDGDRHEQGNPPTLSTLNQALAYVRPGRGDYVIVEHDHAEDISSADQMDNLVAGTRIIGLGAGTLRPTFTWTAAAATWLFDQHNCTIENLRLVMASSDNGGVTVAAPITVSAAGCGIYGCDIFFGDDADDNVGQAINTDASADDLAIMFNRCFGATAAECETFLNLVGTDRLVVLGNHISGATSAVGVGLIRAETTAPTNILLSANYVANNLASSEEAITLMAGTTGFMNGNHLAVLDNLSVAMDALGNVVLDNTNTLSNTTGERGLVLGTESA